MNSLFAKLTLQQQVAALEQTALKALTQWAFQDPQLRLIKYRENAVFECQSNGERYAVRLHRVGYHDDDALRSELQWMVALAKSGIDTPAVVPTGSGELFVREMCDGLGEEIQIDVFEWIDGHQLGSVEEGLASLDSIEQTFATIGSTAARIHNHSSQWTAPDGFKRHAWDAEGLAGETPFWGRFWEIESASAKQRETLLDAKAVLLSDLAALSTTPDRYGMIHADLVAENLMITDTGIKLIDFDDAGFGWYLFELATVLYFLTDEPEYARAKTALIRGYREQRALSDEDLALLPLMLAARGFTYVGWVHTRPETETAREMSGALIEMACEQYALYRSD